MPMQVLVFARAPVAGACKTRLIPRLGARGAAWVQRRLIEQALAVATAAAPGHVVLCCAPDTRHRFLRSSAQRYGASLARQCRGDLGLRMRSALNRALRAGAGPVLLLGADAFDLGAEDLLAAARQLACRADYLLIPAPDGGYGLIGARRPLPRLAAVAWSSGRELAQTRQRLALAGTVVADSAARSDFDTAADWRRARRTGRMQPLIRGPFGT